MKRHNQILLAVLMLQVFLVAFVFWPRRSTTLGKSEPLMGELKADAVVEVEIWDAAENHVLLEKIEGEWVLPEAGNYPCQQDKVTALLTQLTSITTESLITETEAAHQRLKVAEGEFVRKIELGTQTGERVTLYLGSSPSFAAIHVRLAGQPETYLATDLSSYEANATANSWVNTTYYSVPTSDIVSITLKNTHGEWTFEKSEDGTWSMLDLQQGEELNLDGVTSLVNRISSITMTDPLGVEELPDYGMDHPSAVITVRMKDDTNTLYLGAKDPSDKRYILTSSVSPYYVKVAESVGKDLADKVRFDFLKAPPTATMESDIGEGSEAP